MNVHDLKIEKKYIDMANKVYQHKFNGVYVVLKDRDGDYLIGEYVNDSQIIQSLNNVPTIIADNSRNLLFSNI
ncbi:hypothetical protein P4571_08595 [Niallia alba]|uniref:hypothetical protein n=1 Tax=Niallia alba TaxID=2729105 RepID=UPI002E1A7E72|nr:hypothetical protein [Niallia alba]